MVVVALVACDDAGPRGAGPGALACDGPDCVDESWQDDDERGRPGDPMNCNLPPCDVPDRPDRPDEPDRPDDPPDDPPSEDPPNDPPDDPPSEDAPSEDPPSEDPPPDDPPDDPPSEEPPPVDPPSSSVIGARAQCIPDPRAYSVRAHASSASTGITAKLYARSDPFDWDSEYGTEPVAIIDDPDAALALFDGLGEGGWAEIGLGDVPDGDYQVVLCDAGASDLCRPAPDALAALGTRVNQVLFDLPPVLEEFHAQWQADPTVEWLDFVEAYNAEAYWWQWIDPYGVVPTEDSVELHLDTVALLGQVTGATTTALPYSAALEGLATIGIVGVVPVLRVQDGIAVDLQEPLSTGALIVPPVGLVYSATSPTGDCADAQDDPIDATPTFEARLVCSQLHDASTQSYVHDLGAIAGVFWDAAAIEDGTEGTSGVIELLSAAQTTALIQTSTFDMPVPMLADGVYFVDLCDPAHLDNCVAGRLEDLESGTNTNFLYAGGPTGSSNLESMVGTRLGYVGSAWIRVLDGQTIYSGGTAPRVDLLYRHEPAGFGSSDPVCLAAPYWISPLVIDLAGDGIELSSPSDGVWFDLDADGRQERVAWPTEREAGFVVHDRNGNGRIDDGAELFGNATPTGPDTTAEHGFAALATQDTDADGRIDPDDAIYADLQIWVDANRDGASTADELRSLSEVGITSIAVEYVSAVEMIAAGSHSRQRGYAELNARTPLAVLDIWLGVAERRS